MGDSMMRMAEKKTWIRQSLDNVIFAVGVGCDSESAWGTSNITTLRDSKTQQRTDGIKLLKSLGEQSRVSRFSAEGWRE